LMNVFRIGSIMLALPMCGIQLQTPPVLLSDYFYRWFFGKDSFFNRNSFDLALFAEVLKKNEWTD